MVNVDWIEEVIAGCIAIPIILLYIIWWAVVLTIVYIVLILIYLAIVVAIVAIVAFIIIMFGVI